MTHIGDFPMPPRPLRNAQAAEIVGLHPARLRRLARDGFVGYVLRGQQMTYELDELQRYLRESRVPAKEIK